MRAQIRVANDGDVRLEVESATETEADLLHLLRHQLSGRGLYLYSSGLGADLTLQIAAKPAAPQVERRYVPPSRDGVGEVEVKLPTNPGPLPVGYKVPDHFVTVPIEPAAAPQGVGSYAVPQGVCRACLGQTASTLCERELVASREAVRRLWCHALAVNPAGLDRQSALVFAELRREVEALARVAGVA